MGNDLKRRVAAGSVRPRPPTRSFGRPSVA